MDDTYDAYSISEYKMVHILSRTKSNANEKEKQATPPTDGHVFGQTLVGSQKTPKFDPQRVPLVYFPMMIMMQVS